MDPQAGPSRAFGQTDPADRLYHSFASRMSVPVDTLAPNLTLSPSSIELARMETELLVESRLGDLEIEFVLDAVNGEDTRKRLRILGNNIVVLLDDDRGCGLGGRGLTGSRGSRAWFSWMLRVLGLDKAGHQEQAQHNR
jgi:hypothetical protein